MYRLLKYCLYFFCISTPDDVKTYSASASYILITCKVSSWSRFTTMHLLADKAHRKDKEKLRKIKWKLHDFVPNCLDLRTRLRDQTKGPFIFINVYTFPPFRSCAWVGQKETTENLNSVYNKNKRQNHLRGNKTKFSLPDRLSMSVIMCWLLFIGQPCFEIWPPCLVRNGKTL